MPGADIFFLYYLISLLRFLNPQSSSPVPDTGEDRESYSVGVSGSEDVKILSASWLPIGMSLSPTSVFVWMKDPHYMTAPATVAFLKV